jgi:hypothetical protein
MRISLHLALCLLSFAVCQSAPQPVAPVSTPVTAPAPVPERADPTVRQRRHIEALIAQNEALTSRVRELETQPKLAAILPKETLPSAPAETATVLTPPEPPSEAALVPNADGVLDLTAVRTGDETNPFAVRTLPPESVREIALRVGGIVRGPSPCALINGRPVQVGDRIESLDVVRIEPAAVLLRHGAELLRLPLTEKPVRIRLPL